MKKSLKRKVKKLTKKASWASIEVCQEPGGWFLRINGKRLAHPSGTGWVDKNIVVGYAKTLVGIAQKQGYLVARMGW
jgi:hypothetical protein